MITTYNKLKIEDQAYQNIEAEMNDTLIYENESIEIGILYF